MSQHTYMSCTFHVGTTVDDETGSLWTSIRFTHPDGEERQYAYDRDGAVLLIEALTTALAIVEGSSSN